MSGPGCVTADIETLIRVPGMPDPVLLPVTLSYAPADPYAVRARFHAGPAEPVEWTFARELLVRGMTGFAGECDVRVWPAPRGVLGVRLSSPFGEATFDFPARRVREFLDSTYRLVPEGREPDAVGAELDGLFLPGGALHGEGGRA